MPKYLVKDYLDQFQVIQASGFTPEGAIAKLPDDARLDSGPHWSLVNGSPVLNDSSLSQYDAACELSKKWGNLRATRNKLLRESDLFLLPDRISSLTAEQQQALADYRQALRDLPANTQDPTNPVWPEKPQ